MHADQVERLYTAEEAEFGADKVMLVDVDKAIEERSSILDAARFAWKADHRRAEKAEYVMAVRKGIIVGVFVPDKWLEAVPENFPGFPLAGPSRIGFRGHNAPEAVRDRYIDKRAPARKRGEANPVRYTY